MFVKWKLQIEMKLLGKNGIRIEIEICFRMEITLHCLSDPTGYNEPAKILKYRTEYRDILNL